MPRPESPILGTAADVFREIRYRLSNREFAIFAARDCGKTTLWNLIHHKSEFVPEPPSTLHMTPPKKMVIENVGRGESYSFNVPDVGGEQEWWHDTLTHTVESKANVLIFLFRAFRINEKTGEVIHDDHLKKVPGLMNSFAVTRMQGAALSEPGLTDHVYCMEDAEALQFITNLYFNYAQFTRRYQDIIDRCLPGIPEKMRKRKKKLKPKHAYFCVNFADKLDEARVESETRRILRPYEKTFQLYTENGVVVHTASISAKYNKGVAELTEDIGVDMKWISKKR